MCAVYQPSARAMRAEAYAKAEFTALVILREVPGSAGSLNRGVVLLEKRRQLSKSYLFGYCELGGVKTETRPSLPPMYETFEGGLP